jgi:hypothetical protein
MVYECYDQERGMPCAPPPTGVVRENRTRTYLPEAGFQEVASLTEVMARWHDAGDMSDKEAMARWHDVGGTSEAETLGRWHDAGGKTEAEFEFNVGGFSPLQVLKP